MLARVGGDRELLAEMIGLYLEDGPMLVEAMRQGLADSDCAAVRMAAHTLAGTAGNFDATKVTALAQQLEAEALALDLPAARETFIQLDSEAARLLARLTAILEIL